jgi:hypothetical protein
MSETPLSIYSGTLVNSSPLVIYSCCLPEPQPFYYSELVKSLKLYITCSKKYGMKQIL